MTVSVVLGYREDGTSDPICMFANKYDAARYIEIINERSKQSGWLTTAGYKYVYQEYMDTDIIFNNITAAINYDFMRHGPTYVQDEKGVT